MIRRRFAVVFCTTIAISLFLGLTTDIRLAVVTSQHDKLAHYLVFCFETVLFTLMIEGKYIELNAYLPQCVKRRLPILFGSQSVPCINKYILSFVICCLFASVSSEFGQAILSGGKRQFDPMDMVYNFCGSCTGLFVSFCLERQ